MRQKIAMETGERLWLALIGLDGLMAVAAGAFGAHGVPDPQARELLRTGAQYQLVHAAAALACCSLSGRPAAWAARLFGLGGLLFGGSLYLLAATGVRMLGAITPVGGLLMLAGWAALIWTALTRPPEA